MAKTTWDVWVVLANDPNQTVAYVPRWKSIQFSDQLNDVGSATLEHDFSDSFFAAFQTERGDSLLEGPYALQIRRDGAAVFTFFIEDVQVDRAGTNQPLVIGGRGIGSALEWGIVIPEDFSLQARATAGTTQRPKFFDRLFPGYSFNTRVATTGNLSATYTNGPQIDVPGAGARLTSTSNGSINNTGIDGVTDLVVGDTVLVKNQSNAAHNGVYWIVTIGSASTPWVIQRTTRADGSPISDLAVDNAAFVNDGTVNGYSSHAISSNGGLTQSNQVGSVGIVWTQVSLGAFTGISAFYILFKEADTGFEYSSKKEDFGTIKTLYGRGGVGYAVDWPLSLDAALSASQGTTDSKNRVVRDGGNFNIAVGRTLLDVLNEVASNTGVDWHISPQGVISIAVRPFVTDTVVFDEPFGNDLTSGSAALLFSLPMLETVETRTSVSELRTVVYGSDGFNLDRQISDRTGTYGFREMFIENASDDAPAVANITSSAVRQVRDGKLQITASFVENNGMVAWSNFNIGDKVLVEIDTGTFSERIISAISASVDDSGNETIEVTFGDVFQDIASNLKYAANYGRLGAAEIPTFTLRGTSSRPSAPTGTSVGAEVQGLSNRVVVGWESPDNTSATQYEAIVYREEQDIFGITITHPLNYVYRIGNIVYVEGDDFEQFEVGNTVNITDTTNGEFDRYGVILTSVSASATPTLLSEGTVAANTSLDLRITFPTYQENDIVVITTVGWVPNTTTGTNTQSLPSPWTKYSPEIISENPIDTEHAFWWARATSNSSLGPNVTISRPASWDAGSDTCWAGRAYVIRGCITSGSPFDELTATSLSASANPVFPEVQVNGDNRRVVVFMTKADDSTTPNSATGYEVGLSSITTTGTDAAFRVYNQSASANVAAVTPTGGVVPAQGHSVYFAASFKPTSQITFADNGADVARGTYVIGDVTKVLERYSTFVPRDKTHAIFENLAAPGRGYNFIVYPYTSNGQAGVPSAPFQFTASASAQIVLNGAIRSNNYVADTSGWTIEASGDAELNQVTIRNGAWVQGTLTAPTLQTATSNPKLVITSAGLNAFNNAGDIVTSISSTTGALFSSSASISGNITANSLTASATIASPVITGGTIDIGGFDATSFHVDSSGNMWMGASTYATSTFRVSSAGDLRANSGAIAGFRITGDNIITGETYTGSMVMGPTSFGGQPAYQVEYTNGAEGVLSGGALLLQQNGGALVELVAGPAGAAEIVVSDGFYSTVIDATTIGVDFVNPMSTAGISVGGVGITYGGVTYGPGDRNFIGFLWTGTTVYATIDNVAGQYLGGAVFSDRRFKLNIAEPEQQWVDKILNDLKIWQFNKVNPLDEEDLHVYPLEIGVIADEYKQVFPQWESSILLMDPDGADSDKIKSVDYTGLIPGLVLIAQQYKNRFEALEERLTVLESQS